MSAEQGKGVVHPTLEQLQSVVWVQKYLPSNGVSMLVLTGTSVFNF